MQSKGKKCRILFACWLMLVCMVPGLGGCQIVEPEKRAYPLVIGLDWDGRDYQVYLGMAQLAKSTGQGKEGSGQQQGNGEGALLFTGASKEEILEQYGKTRELYLDPGHVQAVILGDGLVREEEHLTAVLGELEKDMALGNSAYVFAADDLEGILGQNGIQVESLGTFLTGMYENRTREGSPVTLEEIYRELHNRGKVPAVPRITVEEDQIFVDKERGR